MLQRRLPSIIEGLCFLGDTSPHYFYFAQFFLRSVRNIQDLSQGRVLDLQVLYCLNSFELHIVSVATETNNFERKVYCYYRVVETTCLVMVWLQVSLMQLYKFSATMSHQIIDRRCLLQIEGFRSQQGPYFEQQNISCFHPQFQIARTVPQPVNCGLNRRHS